MEQFKDMYSNMTITGENGDTVVYTMTFINHVGVMDSAALKPVFAEGVKSVFSSLKAVIADPKIQAIYLNPDGSEAANVTITQADIDALG
jgi:hypothetical protein